MSTIRKAKGAIAKRDLVMFSLLLGTGIRLQSLVNLGVGDIDFHEGTLRVLGKGNVERVVFLNPVVSENSNDLRRPPMIVV